MRYQYVRVLKKENLPNIQRAGTWIEGPGLRPMARDRLLCRHEGAKWRHDVNGSGTTVLPREP